MNSASTKNTLVKKGFLICKTTFSPKPMNPSRFLLYLCPLLFFSINKVDSYIGINWGRQASKKILPSMVVDLILQNGIPEVKIFSASQNMLPALAGSGIGVTVTIPNDDLVTINNVEQAGNWINRNLNEYIQSGLKIRYIAVGSQPFSKMNFNKTYYHASEVLDHMQGAIDQKLHGKGITATMDHFTDVLNDATKPSEADFNADVKKIMVESIAKLVSHNAPVLLDMFPIYSVKSLFNNDIEFSFFDNNSTSKFMDEGYYYTNIFEVVYDKMVCALEKAGFPNIKVVVGQAGWPTDGIEGASEANAERFHKGFIKHILSGKGTPRRPGPIDAYLHNLADENKLKIVKGGERGSFIRHWGIYSFDGKPKYKIDFSGKGRDIEPYSAKGVTHMPQRWCILNTEKAKAAHVNASKLVELVRKACNQTDCTSMEQGGSCGDLDFFDKVSYAFNTDFQSKSQKLSDKGCYFDGYGVIVPDDPSTENCTFPIEIIGTEYARKPNGTTTTTTTTTTNTGLILAPAKPPAVTILSIILSIFFAVF